MYCTVTLYIIIWKYPYQMEVKVEAGSISIHILLTGSTGFIDKSGETHVEMF